MRVPRLTCPTPTTSDPNLLPKLLVSSVLISPVLVLRYGLKAWTTRTLSLRLSRMKVTTFTTSTFMMTVRRFFGGSHISTGQFENLLLQVIQVQNAYDKLWNVLLLKDKTRILESSPARKSALYPGRTCRST